MTVVKENANAKINLYLDVISRRDDGFHDIKTVMHSISLSDVLTVSFASSRETNIRISLKGNRHLPTDGKNLAFKAADLFLKKAGIKAIVDIKLEKHIPIAAGLAGGSSDAAAVLRALNRICGKMFTERALYSMALELGSDVPYCLYGKTALCEGRGEVITKLPDKLKLCVVVAVGNEHMSTPIAYNSLDEHYSFFDGSVPTGGEEYLNALLSSINDGNLRVSSLFNVFENAVLPLCAGAQRIKVRLLELGASASLMSGSGPSVFGVFSDIESAKNACLQLRAENVLAYYAVSV